MFNVDSFREQLATKRVQQLVDNFMASDVFESYMLYRGHDGIINLQRVNRMTIDRRVHTDTEYSVDAEIELSLIPDDSCLSKCSSLITEYKQIKEYEEAIENLKKDKEDAIRGRRHWHSKYLHDLQSQNAIQYMRDDLDAVERGDWFAMFHDNYSKDSAIMQVTLPRSDDFFNSDYWNELFTKKGSNTTIYDTPNVTYKHMGCNHWFVICDASSRTTAIHHLLYYPTEPYEIVHADKEYMYEHLNDIWFDTFGTYHD